jgi:hypothetical protein
MTFAYSRVALLALALAFLGAIAATNMRDPFVGVHWDSPIWLHSAKGYAETSYVTALRHCAQDFEGSHASSTESGVPDCFGNFARLGHTVLLGMVVELFGSTVEAVHVAHHIFYLLLALTVLFVGLMTLSLHHALQGEVSSNRILSGIFISSFLYLSSELFSHIGNSMISDVPSLAVLSLAGLTLVQGLTLCSRWRLILSGVCGFLAYVIRLESLWAYVSLLLALATVFFLCRRHRTWWIGFLIAGLSSLLPLVAYWIAFYPFGSPLVYLAFAKQVKQLYSSAGVDYGYIFFVRAGGLLWIGALICILSKKISTVGRVALMWLSLLILPWLPWLFEKGPTQTRHYVLLMMPLMIISSLGWAAALERAEGSAVYRRVFLGVFSCACVLGLISHTHNYQWVRQLPGLWRLDVLRSDWLLGPSLREQPTYPVDEAVQLSRIIYDVDSPTVVVRSKTIPLEDFLYLIRFFGSSYQSNVDFFKYTSRFGPESLVPCSQLLPKPEVESAVYTADLSETCRAIFRSEGVRMLHLTYLEPGSARGLLKDDETEILTTKHYLLSRIN